MQTVLKASGDEHAAAVNDLAERGIIEPVTFEFGGQTYVANSIWAATGWLKSQGYYKSPPVEIVIFREGEYEGGVG